MAGLVPTLGKPLGPKVERTTSPHGPGILFSSCRISLPDRTDAAVNFSAKNSYLRDGCLGGNGVSAIILTPAEAHLPLVDTPPCRSLLRRRTTII